MNAHDQKMCERKIKLDLRIAVNVWQQKKKLNSTYWNWNLISYFLLIIVEVLSIFKTKTHCQVYLVVMLDGCFNGFSQ